MDFSSTNVITTGMKKSNFYRWKVRGPENWGMLRAVWFRILFSHLLSKSIKIKIHTIIILGVLHMNVKFGLLP
jgi:hypothetical protein